MLTRLAIRINSALETVFPEQRLYLKSDHGTHYLRLKPMTQALVVVIGALGLAWTIVATSLFMMQSIGAGSAREQTLRQGIMFEERLTLLSADRDLRATEALQAQERFNQALEQVSSMQGMLLASEDRRRELETGIDVIQNTLRRAIRERDEARAEISRLTVALSEQGGGATEMGRIRDTVATLDYLTGKLDATARERDSRSAEAEAARGELLLVQEERRALELRHDAIFAKLEEAVTVSVEPLEKMFRAAGMNPNDLIATVRKGYSGQGGPLTPISASSMGGTLSSSELRANAILKRMEEMDLYRLAAWKAPFANPILSGGVRMTSGFGSRNDPFGAGRRMHEGQDFAGAYGTPIYATADGTVIHAGWQSGYGRLIKIRHAFGVETRYAHLSQIRVEVGQKVSRGDRIGDMGNSGRSTGTHLHYEVRIGGAPVNPMTFIKAARDVF
ncbi:M23 family metallopeptidase [Pseudogemmobacter humi]|uniref:Murein DD-endopeptidase MepM n=1 Tax=Pseudogemmobacter humi TaxID=2483812 RepID=A0A3P5XVC9_9RHOB|nr:M23 family metallopeptidase [Pseudogemmobacter humi]VDC33045.1 Murein DD-endopeptidase MepM [Pseudogemmobacter humi]